MIRISVCIPVFNAERYVADTINCVLNQNYPTTEVIVVDDGSSDGSSKVLARFEGLITTLTNATPRGAAAARNRAFAVSSGDAVLFLDSDDLIGPGHFVALSKALDRVGSKGIAFGRWARFRESPDEAFFPYRPTERDMKGTDWLLTDWRDARPMTQCGTFLLSRDLIEAVGAWDERLSLIDDFEFFARLITASSGMAFAQDAQLYYRSDIQSSLSRQKGRKAAESQLLSLVLGTGHLLAVSNTAETRSVCAGLLVDFDYTHFPDHSDLRAEARARVAKLGGSSLKPDGPPGFHALRPFLGWRIARRIQRLAEAHGLNGAARNGVQDRRRGA